MDDFQRLSRRIESIEDKDPNFKDNPTWQRLRAKQDLAYIELAKQRLEFHKKELEVRNRDYDKQKVDFYESYIAKNEKGEKTNDYQL